MRKMESYQNFIVEKTYNGRNNYSGLHEVEFVLNVPYKISSVELNRWQLLLNQIEELERSHKEEIERRKKEAVVKPIDDMLSKYF